MQDMCFSHVPVVILDIVGDGRTLRRVTYPNPPEPISLEKFSNAHLYSIILTAPSKLMFVMFLVTIFRTKVDDSYFLTRSLACGSQRSTAAWLDFEVIVLTESLNCVRGAGTILSQPTDDFLRLVEDSENVRDLHRSFVGLVLIDTYTDTQIYQLPINLKKQKTKANQVCSSAQHPTWRLTESINPKR